MNRIIIGDFKSIKKIEKLVCKENYNFGVFVDFDSINMIDFKIDEYDQIIIFIDDIEILKREYLFFQNNKSKIILWVKGKSIKPYANFLKNQGYQIIKGLKYFNNNSGIEKANNLVEQNKKNIGIRGNFDFAIQLAETLSDDNNIMFIDADSINCFSTKRLRVDIADEKMYINEPYDYEKLAVRNKFRKFHLISFPDGYKADNCSILKKFIEESVVNFDYLVIYFNEDFKDVYLSELVDSMVFTSDVTYENIIKINHSLKIFKNCSYVGIKNKSLIGDYFFIRENLLINQFMIINGKNLLTNGKPLRWIDLGNMSKKSKTKFKGIFNKLMDWRGDI